jgi:hypothetical protein
MEVAKLRDNWGITLGELSRIIGRSKQACYLKAMQLRLGSCPRGWETIAAAAKRCGFEHKTMRMILKYGEVPVHRLLSSRLKATRMPKRMVQPFEADEAVAKWMRAERPTTAARRHGISGVTLTKWLKEAGVERRVDSWFWWVDSAVIDRVVEERLASGNRRMLARRVEPACSEVLAKTG